MGEDRKAFDLPEWCPDVVVPDVEVVDACDLPGMPRPEAFAPPDVETPLAVPLQPMCQPIHVTPYVDIVMPPPGLCQADMEEYMEGLEERRGSERSDDARIARDRPAFQLEKRSDDACDGRYQMDITFEMPCVFEDFPSEVVAGSRWERPDDHSMSLPAAGSGCSAIPSKTVSGRAPKAVLRHVKSGRDCQVPDITLDMSIPCPLDSLTDVEFGYDSNGHHVEVFSRKALEEASGPRMKSSRAGDCADECDLEDFTLDNIVVPAGCYNTEITSQVNVEYVSPGGSFSGGVEKGEKTGPKNDESCEFELDPPMIRIPLPRPCALSGGSTSLDPRGFKDIFGRETTPFKFSEKIKDQLKVGDGSGPLNEFTLSNLEIMRRSNLNKAVEYALGSHVNVFPDKFRNVLGRGGAVFDSNGNELDSNDADGFDECDTAASVDIQLRCPNLPRIVSDSNGQVVRETGKKNRFTVIRGKYLDPADDDSIACTGDVVLHTVQELVPDSVATQSEYGERVDNESYSLGIKQDIAPAKDPTMVVRDDRTGEARTETVNTDARDHVLELYNFHDDTEYSEYFSQNDDMVVRRRNGTGSGPVLTYVRAQPIIGVNSGNRRIMLDWEYRRPDSNGQGGGIYALYGSLEVRNGLIVVVPETDNQNNEIWTPKAAVSRESY